MEIKEWLGKNNTLGYDIFTKKYLLPNESLEEWFDRVSNGNADLKQALKDKKFLFGGRALANRGSSRSGSMFNCYSSGYAPDDVKGLMELNKNIALTYKSQGGQGLSLSKLRPKGTPIGTEYKSDGIVPFMEIFNTTTASISQGGARKGALMMSIDISHKEAETFITIKNDLDKITKANLSLEIDDKFMTIVSDSYKDDKYYKDIIKREYEGHQVEYEICPRQLYELMIQNAYDYAEPGCIFTNQFRNYNLMEFVDGYEIVTSNPCGEQPLPKNFSCNLGSLNLSAFVRKPYTLEAYFDFEDFEKHIKIGIRALDGIIDENLNRHALKEQAKNSKNYRNIGLGVFGYANMLFMLRIKYGSEEAKIFTDALFNFMFRTAVIEDSILAEELGAFPKFNKKVWDSTIIKNHFSPKELEDLRNCKLRNCSLLSIAPTGSIATMFGLSGGCEPEFALAYTRNTDNLKESYEIECKSVQDYREILRIAKGSKLPDYFVCAADINWRDRIDIQSIMQKHVDTAISSTINLPKETTLEEINDLYLMAWEKKLKGVTIYRSGCKREGILTTDNKTDNKEQNFHNDDGYMPDDFKETYRNILENKRIPSEKRGEIKQAHDNVIGLKRKLMTGCGSLHCTAFFDADTSDLVEVYLSKGSTGGCNNFMIGLSRLISLAARGGISIIDIVDQLMSTGSCPSYTARKAVKHDTSKGSCCPVAVGYALKEMWEDFQGKELKPKDTTAAEDVYIKQNGKEVHLGKIDNFQFTLDTIPRCPECGERLTFEGGCNICRSCGYSKCD